MYGKRISRMSGQIDQFIAEYSWPGNIRELKNFIESAIIFSDNVVIDEEAISEQYALKISQGNKDSAEIEDYHTRTRSIILDALNQSHGKKTDAAMMLKISRKTLYNRMKKLNIE